MLDAHRARAPAWTVAPDIYAIILRDWIEALELKLLKYRSLSL